MTPQGQKIARALDDGTFQLEMRIVHGLERANGQRLSALQIAQALKIAPGEHANPSEPMRELLRLLDKLVEYKKISQSYPSAERPEFAY